MSFPKGGDNPRWKGGRYLNDKGYVRIGTRKHRGKYEHRYVMECMLRRPVGLVFPGDGKIPAGMHVHHNDHDRTHNCRSNLMLLQGCIHNALSRSYRKYLLNHWDEYMEWIRRENDTPPAWVTEDGTFA